ncbi:MAG: thioredoxin domain-containing protein [Xanthomonadales bacterium PRO7]|nr:thioredoxin domain-containing protein [Xanthomonadales bacterium PRO7]
MPNHLAAESSPYLRQHADNPVHWWPWSDAALAAARTQEKPILLSIGYSACHWCHVMAHESFEDAATAALMNELFICIKVDREERPDLDRIYQLAHQALTRRGGGWPLTVFLTPDDHLPFYAGTYFPKQPRYGMPPFAQVLREVRRWWDTQRGQVRQQNSALSEFLADQGRGESNQETLDDTPIRAAMNQIEAGFDPHNGGHRGAPKFPHCTEMDLLLDLGKPEHVEFTLARMADGGIHDQIGGGFARYSVDERWEIPHFEKMLYDNAQLLPLYAASGHADVAHGILGWLLREMTAPSGGFYAALDADSEHEEGRFYVWQRDEVRALLDPDEFAVAAPHWGFDRAPNFEGKTWNPIVAVALADVAQTLGIAPDRAAELLASARRRLFAARALRVRPGLDDKILTSWNALMIAGIARTARALDAPPLLGLAERALDNLYADAWRDGRLYAKAGVDAARFPGYLDDYAILLHALLEMLQCRWSARDLAWAIVLAECLLERFVDHEHGGFFFTAHDHEALIQRPKPFTDEALPSGNGVAARALLHLGHLLGETRYLDAAERTLRAGFSTMRQMPQACCAMLHALNDFLHPRTHVALRVDGPTEESMWRAAFAKTNSRRVDAYFIPAQAGKLPGILATQHYAAGGLAYVCRGTQCLPPLQSAAGLGPALRV